MKTASPRPHVVSIDTVIQLYKEANGASGHWFDPDTMRFFKSVLPREAYLGLSGNYYFFTRETNPSRESRYSVRVFDPRTGKIDTVGEFHSISGPKHALKATLDAAGEP